MKIRKNIQFMYQIGNLKNYDSNVIIQELSKFNLKNKCYTKWIRKVYELYDQ